MAKRPQVYFKEVKQMDEDIWRRLICYCDDEYISRIKAYSLNWQEASITFQFYDGTYEIFYYMEETWFKIGKLPMSKEKMNEYFGHKLQKYMYMHAMTQHRLAIASGVSQKQISEYINGVRIPNFYTISRFANILHVSTDVFRFRFENPVKFEPPKNGTTIA